jgi:Tfp pilus assembly protein PilN
MITINLKPGSKRAKAGSSLAGGLSTLRGLPGRVKDPWPMAAVATWVLLVGFLGWAWLGSAARMRSLGPQLEAARSENRRYKTFMVEKKKAVAARDSVVIQIATIRAVDGERYVWPRILDEVTRALPSYTWLIDLSSLSQAAVPNDAGVSASPAVGIQLVGRTMDIQGFTRFMRQLEDSPWLKDVTVISTETVIDRGRAVTAFTVKANFVRPGRTQTEAAPVSPAGEN